jgi:antitoxin (DNA-binding transcriptional repressor) of toxin-antitoxin stability system
LEEFLPLLPLDAEDEDVEPEVIPGDPLSDIILEDRREWRQYPFVSICVIMCTQYVHIIRAPSMETVKIGMREFRSKLAQYLLEADTPIAITRHGETVGFFIPARPKRAEAEKAALQDAAERFDRLLAESGVTEEELVADFKTWRAKKRKRA